MMSIKENFAVVCLECTGDPDERSKVDFYFKRTRIIQTSEYQLNNFSANRLQVGNSHKNSTFGMSLASCGDYNTEQFKELKKYESILYAPIPAIKRYGHGGVQCKISEIFLQTPTLKAHQ